MFVSMWLQCDKCIFEFAFEFVTQQSSKSKDEGCPLCDKAAYVSNLQL